MRLANLESKVFVGLVLAISAFFVWMVRGFFLPIFWAAIFAILFQPLVNGLTEKLRGRRTAAAGLGTLIVVVVVVVPFTLLVAALAQQAMTLYQRVESGELNLQAPLAFLERVMPAAAGLLARVGVGPERMQLYLNNAAALAADLLASQALALGQNALRTAVLFALMLYLLFFFFRDGERLVTGLIRALPMGDERERRLLHKFADVSRATVKGTLVVAAVQGVLGGVLFALLGIEAAVFWGVMMGILSLLPAVGPALVWGPAAIILIVGGSIVKGLIMIVVGSLLIGLIDNLLRPILVGRQTEMPDYLVLLATLGGLSVFGLAGFVAGPIVAALCLVMWEMFAQEYAELDTSAPPEVVAAVPTPVVDVGRDVARPPMAGRPSRDPASQDHSGDSGVASATDDVGQRS